MMSICVKSYIYYNHVSKDQCYFLVTMYVLILLMSSFTPFIMSDQLSLQSGLNIIC